MSIKQVICAISVVFVGAGQVLAEPMHEKFKILDTWSLKNSEFQTSLKDDTIFWLPKIEGKTRYQFQIPREGLTQAFKLRDTGALYYLTGFNDTSLSFADTDMMAITLAPKSLGVDFFWPEVAFDGRYSIGVELRDWTKKNSSNVISLGYAKIIKKNVMLAARLQADRSLATKNTLGTTFLNGSETVQYTGWVENSQQASDYYKFALQSKFFDALWDMDGALQFSDSNSGSHISTSIHKDINGVKSSFGIEWSEKSSAVKIFVGFTSYQKNKNGNILQLHSTSKSGAARPSWLDDLKSLRKQELMSYWKAKTDFLLNN
jgi:hypothetical protein